MTKNEALQEMKKELHVSHSQIFTYLNCSLKYRFMYVEAKPPERVSIALPFGTAIHASLERYYRTLKARGVREPLGVILNYFEHRINLELDQMNIPVVFKKDTPDRDAVIDMGDAMLETFYDEMDLTGFEILEVERGATDKEIKKAYRQLSLKFHPDKVRGARACRGKAPKLWILCRSREAAGC